MPKKTKEEKKTELLKKLRELAQSGDAEAAHSEADDALMDFIDDQEIRDAYEAIPKWYA